MKRTILVAVLALLASGCVAFDPGGQVRKGLTQSKVYEWRDDGNFWAEGRGPQTERFTMAQGVIVMTVDDDGEPVIDFERSRLEYYLRADPSADAASSALAQALQASTQQMAAFTELMGTAIQAVMPLLAARQQPAEPEQAAQIEAVRP